MKHFFTFLTYSLLMVTVLFGQEYHDLKANKAEFLGNGQLQQGTAFTLTAPAKADIAGSDESISLVTMEFRNLGFLEAQLSVEFEVQFKPSDYAKVPGDYFITLSFFDEDMKCLLSESFVSEGGFTVSGVPQNAGSNPPLTRSVTGDNTYKFTGKALVPIHPAFFYGADQSAGGIKPIKQFTFTAFHLGAG